MLVEILLQAATVALGSLIIGFFASIWETQSMIRQIPQSLEAPMSDHDREMANRSRELIRDCFCTDGNSVSDTIRHMTPKERLQAAQDFSAKLAELNGLELDISFFSDNNISNCGGYNANTNTASFNIVELMWDGNDEKFEDRILNFIDTIVHEQRHAVQIRAIRDKDFWQFDDERRAAWANNLPPRYIRPSVDARAYRCQPLESDAFTYAALVLEGVN